MDVLLAAARLLHFAAAIQLFGIAAFYALLLPDALRPALERPFRRVAFLSALLTLLGGIVWLLATAGSMANGLADAVNPQIVGTVLSQTAFGRVWGPHLVLAGLALIAVAWRGKLGWWLLTILATAVLGSLGLVGHAAIDAGVVGILNRISQVLHVLSSGFWLGALVPLLFVLPRFGNASTELLADQTLRHFSGLGHMAVAVLLLSGLANTWFILGPRVDLAAPYEQLLVIKIALAGSMCLLAIVNRYVFMPRIPHGGPGARLLAHGTVAEIVLGGLILGLVSVLGMLAPGTM
jgi:putative copper resistance protein D